MERGAENIKHGDGLHQAEGEILQILFTAKSQQSKENEGGGEGVQHSKISYSQILIDKGDNLILKLCQF